MYYTTYYNLCHLLCFKLAYTLWSGIIKREDEGTAQL